MNDGEIEKTASNGSKSRSRCSNACCSRMQKVAMSQPIVFFCLIVVVIERREYCLFRFLARGNGRPGRRLAQKDRAAI